MPRPNTVWYRTGTDSWYVKIDGRAVSLGVKGKDNRNAALIAFGRVLALPQPTPTKDGPTVTDLLDGFLIDARLRLKPQTVSRYEYDIESFRRAVGDLPARSLTHRHLKEWLATVGPSSTTKAIMLRSVSAALGWAVREELLEFNPATKVPKPKTRSRTEDAMISEADHRKLLDAATKEFRLVLHVLHDSGCRPGEVCRLTAENFRPDADCFVLPEHKTDSTGRPRIVFLPPELIEDLSKLTKRYETGPLLRSRKGVPWSARSIRLAMRHLRKKTGVRATAYGYRHTFLTDLLASGVSNSLAAQLAGHVGTTVIDRHYAHLGAKADALRNALKSRKTG